jgi:cell division protein FtsZ
LIFGAVVDPSMGENLRITVIATGFERTGVPRSILERPTPRFEEKQIQEPQSFDNQIPSRESSEFQPRTFNTEDLDIPTFLRNRR